VVGSGEKWHGGTCGVVTGLSASGKEILPGLDGHGPANSSFDPRRLEKALALFQKLSAADRRPRVADLPAVWRRAGYPAPPKGGVTLKLHGRAFGLDNGGRVHGYERFGGEPMLDYFWLTQEEAETLVPRSPRKGDTGAAPRWFARRVRQYRMLAEPLEGSGLLGHKRVWHPNKAPGLTLTVAEVSAGEVCLRLHGSVPIRFVGWDYQNRRVAAGDYDCDYEFLGYLNYDLGKKAFTRFDLVAVGEIKQLGRFPYPRPKAGVLMSGLTFTLANGTPTESIPPYALFAGRSKDYYSHDDD